MNEGTSASQITKSTVVTSIEHQTTAQVDGENVILDLDEGVYYGLDPVGAQIWKGIEEPSTVGEVASDIAGEYDVSEERCMRDVISLLEDLQENGLIVIKEE